MLKRKIVDGKTYLSIKEASQRLQHSESTIRRYCESGDLQFMRFSSEHGRSYRFVEEESVNAFLRKLTDQIKNLTDSPEYSD